MCKQQASGVNHFQFGHDWEGNLPVEEHRKYCLNSLLNIPHLSVFPSSDLNTGHPRANQRESSQVEGGLGGGWGGQASPVAQETSLGLVTGSMVVRSRK